MGSVGENSSMLTILLCLVSVCLSPGVHGRLWSPNDTDDFFAGARPSTDPTVTLAQTTSPSTDVVAGHDEARSPYIKEWNAFFDFHVPGGPIDDMVEVRATLGDVESAHAHQLDVFSIKMYCVEDCKELLCDQLSVCENRASGSHSAVPQLVDQPASVCMNARENCGRATSIFVNATAFTACCARVIPNAPWLCNGDEGNTNACWLPRAYKTIELGVADLPPDYWFPGFDWLESRPLSLALLAVVFAMFVALCLLMVKWWKARESALEGKKEDPYALRPIFPMAEDDYAFGIMKRGKVLLAYYPDCEEMCEAVAALAEAIRADGACEVTDMCCELEPMDLEPLMSAPDVHVLIIPSRVGKMGHNVYFDQSLPGRIVEPAEPKDTSHRLFYNFLYHARAGALRLKPDKVAVIGLHPAWQEEHYEQAVGGLRNMETYLVPENTSALLKWLHGLPATIDLRLDATDMHKLQKKIDAFRSFIKTDDDYHLRHVLVVDTSK